MKVLVTGGAGFIGSHIVDRLVAEGYAVAAVDNLSTGRRENLNPSAVFYHLDISSPGLEAVFREFQPQMVIHQAAQSSVTVSLREPLKDADTNIRGTINLLELCRRYHVLKLVYASSAAVYGSPRYLPIDEQHPVNPTSFYGISKYAAERYLEVYRQLYGITYVILRYANVYGPRQDPQGEGGVVSIFADRLTRGEPVTIFGDGEQTRDFIFVGDVVHANILALTRGDNQVLNISTGTQTTVNQLYHLMFELCRLRNPFSSPSEPRIYQPERPGDIKHSFLLSQKARESLGWEPQLALLDGLRETIGGCSVSNTNV
ncbi:MAG: SDR family oxidoreductase [Syntrophomonadaceae bacterium]|nr:SDR family oxidoreductase [Syntrophomonadaceae bacterium]